MKVRFTGRRLTADAVSLPATVAGVVFSRSAHAAEQREEDLEGVAPEAIPDLLRARLAPEQCGCCLPAWRGGSIHVNLDPDDPRGRPAMWAVSAPVVVEVLEG